MYCRSHCVCVSPYVFLRVCLFFSCRLFFARVRVLCLPCVLVIVLSFCCVWLVCLRLCLALFFSLAHVCVLAHVYIPMCIFPCAWCLLSSHVFCLATVRSLDTIVLLHSRFFQKSLQRLLHFNTSYLAHRHAALPPSFGQNEMKLVDIRARPCFWCVVRI